MAIQQRRGAYNAFDPAKMIEGEIAVVKTGDPHGKENQGIYYCYQTGKVKRIADYDENMGVIAKSWAVGPNGTGDSGTDTNNAKYWAGIAQTCSSTPPYIGANGNWWVWNQAQQRFVDSGVDASITVRVQDVTMLDPSKSPYVTNTGTDTDPIFHLFIPRGKGITSIRKSSSQGLVDTYEMLYSDGTKYYYYVTNGKTAYQSAQEGGYSGTESQFYEELGRFEYYATQASQSASSAATSATSAETARAAAVAAQTSAESAKEDAETAKSQAEIARTGAETARTGAETAQAKSETAQSKAELAQSRAEAAESNAKTSETNAHNSEVNASTSETNASTSETNAAQSATDARNYYESITGNVIFIGTTTFANIPTSALAGWEYNVTDSFTTDERFETPGVPVTAGAFIVYTNSGKWSVIYKGSIDISYDNATETIVIVK